MSYQDDIAALEKAAARIDGIRAAAANVNERQAAAVGQMVTRYPTLAPGITYALGSAVADGRITEEQAHNVGDQAANSSAFPLTSQVTGNRYRLNIGSIAQMGRDDQLAQGMTPEAIMADERKNYEAMMAKDHHASFFDNPVSAISRGVFSALKTPLEVVQNLGSSILNAPQHFVQGVSAASSPNNLSTIGVPDAGEVGTMNPADLVKGTSIYQYFAEPNSGSGYLDIAGPAKTKLLEAQGAYRGYTTDPLGQRHVNSIGRIVGGWAGGSQMALNIPDWLPGLPDEIHTTPYDLLSGAIDFGVSWYGDPMNRIGKLHRAGRALDGGYKLIPEAAVQAAEELKTVNPSTAGLFLGRFKKVDGIMAGEFFNQTKKGQKVLDALAAEESAGKIFLGFGGRIDPQIASDLAKATDREQVWKVLSGHAGLSSGMESSNVYRKGLNAGVTNKLDSALNRWGAYERLTAEMPGRHLVLDANAAPWQKIETINNMDNWLRLINTPESRRLEVVTAMVHAMGDTGTRAARYSVASYVESAIKDALVAEGWHPTVAHNLTKGFGGMLDSAVSTYMADAAGLGDDVGLAEQILATTDFNVPRPSPEGNGVIFDASSPPEVGQHVGPALLSEGLNSSLTLPDPARIRRMTGSMHQLFAIGGIDGGLKAGKKMEDILAHGTGTLFDRIETVNKAIGKVGQLRVPFAALDAVVNTVWRTATIMRPATIMRVLFDEQFRMGQAGASSFFHHPIDFFVRTLGSEQGKFDALGRAFSENPQLANEMMTEWQRAVKAQGSWFGDRATRIRAGQAIDSADASRLARYKTMSVVAKAQNPVAWKQGMLDEIRALTGDPIVKRIAMGDTDGAVLSWLRNDEVGQSSARELYDRLVQNGDASRIPGETAITRAHLQPSSVGGSFEAALRDPMFEPILRKQIEDSRALLTHLAGDDEELLKFIGTGLLGSAEEEVANNTLTVVHGVSSPSEMTTTGRTWTGSTVRDSGGRVGVVTNDARRDGYSIVKFDANGWDETNSKALHGLVGRWFEDGRSPDKVRHWMPPSLKSAQGSSSVDVVKSVKDKTLRFFFSEMWQRSSASLSRSPYFRHAYWSKVSDLLPAASREAADGLLATLGEHGLMTPDMLDGVYKAAGKARGTLGLEAIDGYAKGHALDAVKALLYDASEKSNFADAIRVISPFFEAWREFVSRQAMLIAHNPSHLNRIQKVVNGARAAGFFGQDANGQEVFKYPLLGDAANLLVPGATVTGRVQGLAQGLEFFPGLSTVALLPVGKVLDQMDKFTDTTFLRKVLTPYGTPESIVDRRAWTPSWLNTLIDGIRNEGEFANARITVARVLLASGKYDISTEDGIKQLQDDAGSKAGWLTILRGLGKFVLPSSPRYDYQMQTEVGDMMASALGGEYARLIKENPDTASERFLQLYGNQFEAWTVGKTQSLIPGLQASEAFDKWQKNNETLLGRYKDIAGYFGPSGDNYSASAYQWQMSHDFRKVRTVEELAHEINRNAAYDKYKALRAQMPEKLNAAGQEYLSQFKQSLADQYPGFDPNVTSIKGSKIGNQITNLTEALRDPLLADNEVADVARKYMAKRDEAIAVSLQMTGKSNLAQKADAGLRDFLFQYGEALATENPQFQRLWASVLSQEVIADGI